MKKILTPILLLLLCQAAFAQFPEVPDYIWPRQFEWQGVQAEYYLWNEGPGEGVYLYVVPKDGEYTFFGEFKLLQGAKEVDAVVYDSVGTFGEGKIDLPTTLQVKVPLESPISFADELTVSYSHAGNSYIFFLRPPSFYEALPANGIWKSSEEDGLSIYFQRYAARSCILVVTAGDGTYTVFLDSDYTDGVYASDDIDNGGYSLQFSTTDSSHGTITVRLPGLGEITTDVELTFPE